MISLRGELKVSATPIDFRRGVHGLVVMVAETLRADPYCGNVFVFRSKRKNRIKMIFWDGAGMFLMTKWLEEGAFVLPPVRDGVVVLTATQFSVLVAGLDWTRVTREAARRPYKVA